MQMITLRGVPESRLKKPLRQAGNQKDVPAYKFDSIRDMLTYYLSCTSHASASHVTAVEKGAKIGPFYPKVFDNRIGKDGSVVHARPLDTGNVFG